MIKPMMNGKYASTRPTTKFGGEGLARRDCDVGPADRPLGNHSPQVGIEPRTVLMTRTQITIEIRGSVNRIARKQDLRHRRFSQCDVSGGKQDIGTATPDQFGKLCLFVPEAASLRNLGRQKVHIVKAAKLLPENGTQGHGNPEARLRTQMRKNIADVG